MEAKELANKLTEYPDIKERFEQLIKIVENPNEETTLADVAEQCLIDELQILGKNTLQDWANKQAAKSARQLEKNVKTAKKNIKKKVYWYSTFGKIDTEEQTYYQKGKGSLLRPFIFSAQVLCRGYSLLLQRRITDFGADVPFGRVNHKLQEHYGITVSESAIRNITLEHAGQIKLKKEEELKKVDLPNNFGKPIVISETDGSMVPIVKTADEGDKRKQKQLFYREAKLTLAHEKGSISPVFSATFGNADMAGKHMLCCVKKAGADNKTKICCLGDGAKWIVDQAEKNFGANVVYLIDFYHVCEYLSLAVNHCAPEEEKERIEEKKRLLKQSKICEVLKSLEPYIEKQEIPNENAPVRNCYRYINNRINQLDYLTAINNDLPIGSGEIESAHRYIIQKRLKISGAWWLEDNADNMLALRINRANNDWNQYWNEAA